jgi:hypothetical protein
VEGKKNREETMKAFSSRRDRCGGGAEEDEIWWITCTTGGSSVSDEMPFHSESVSEPSSITLDSATEGTVEVSSMASNRDSKWRRKISIASRAGDSSAEE